jgi:hypothetical protein
MDVAGSDEGVQARPFRLIQSTGGAFHVEVASAGECRHARLRELPADRVDRFEVSLGSNGEPGFEDIDAEFDQFSCHAEFFRNRHAASGRLFAVPERRVEDVNAIVRHTTHALD